MPNTTYSFAAVAGQTIAFDAATDVLSFGAGVSAAGLTLSQVGATLVVTMGGSSVTLSAMSLDKLRTGALTFTDGSQVLVGDGLATTGLDSGTNTLTGGTGHDYLNGLGGNDTLNGGKGNDTIWTGTGSDTVDAGEGDDKIYLDADLQAADKIDGGAGVDELHLNGNYSNLVLGATTITNVEKLILDGDNNAAVARTYKLTSVDATVADGASMLVDGSALDAADTLNFDGSAEVSGSYQLTGGAGSDTLKGGAGNDVIVGGAGNDLIVGGQGADVLTGGAGIDTFSFARGTTRSDSSPTSIDRVTDFEGAGVAGGDLIQLPVPNGGKPLAFAGYKAFSLGGGQQAPNPGDGFADVFFDNAGGQTRIAVDVNDDGLITEVDQVILLDGTFTLQAEDFDAAFSIVRGTTGPDTILGSAYGETINALGGNDIVSANGGVDTVYGGTGDDTIDGGLGADKLYGEADNDTIHGGDDNDAIDGGDGADFLYGDNGADTITGGAGVDTVDGGQGGDTIDGNDGNDILHGGSEDDTVRGGNDQDQLFGDAGNDTLEGGAGDDQLDGGADNDTLKGGGGMDTLHGGQGNDILYGDDGSTGDAVADNLFGDEGNDTLYAGSGRDILTGGLGADKFVVTSAASSAANPNRITDFSAAEGDTLQLSISGGKPLAWFGNKPFFFDGTFGNGGVQFPLAGDGLADAIWDYDAGTNTTRLAVDVNDDGVFSTSDLLVYLTGQFNLTASNFTDTFTVIRGGAGDDVMPGTANADTYYGMGGNDTITGLGGNDTLYGGDGNDTIDGGTGQDTIYGEDGNDTLTGGDGVTADYLYGGVGDDNLDGGDGADILNGGTGNDTLVGGLGDDVLYGYEGQDNITAGDGGDTVYGGADNDTIDGGAGNDMLSGDDGADTIHGGDNNDTIYGGAAADNLFGDGGDDTIYTDAGADTVDAGQGNDTIIFGQGDTVTGGAGNDTFRTYHNSDVSNLANQARITDWQASDKLEIAGVGGLGISLVFNAGDQHFGPLSTAAGSQTVLGNAGDGLADVFYSTEGATTRLIVDVNDDGKLDTADIVVAFDGDLDFASTDFIANQFKVQRGTGGADLMTGTDTVDILYGVGGNDTINALGGNDTVYGGAGDDTIDGGLGQDTLDGGADNDIIYGGDGVTTDYLYGQDGNDALDGGAGDDYLYGGTGVDILVGGLGGDTLQGDAGDDNLDGGDGNDTLRGNADNDTLTGGIGNDTLEGGDGTDTLNGGADNDSLDGGNGTDTLFGNDGNDTLDGGNNADVLDGGAGNDTLIVGAGDTLTGGADADTFKAYYNSNASVLAAQARITDFQQGLDKFQFTAVGGNGKTYVFNNGDRHLGALSTAVGSQTLLGNGGDGLADVLYTTSNDGQTTQLIIDLNDDGKLDAADLVIALDGDLDLSTADFIAGTFQVLRGSEGDDTINGTADADTIYGVGGNDTINGLEGNDSLYGAAGNDTIDGGLGQDTIDGGDDNDTLFGGAGSFKDTLIGGAGDDSLDGGDGDDNLYGGLGNDHVIGGLGGDYVQGNEGNDTIEGGEGDDTLYAQDGNDIVDGGIGDDYIDGGTGNDTITGGEGDDKLYGSTGQDNISGGAGNDLIWGEGDADTLNGGDGDDTIVFGKNDLVTGGTGADVFRTYYNSEASVLGSVARITDFQKGVDKLELNAIGGNGKLFVVDPGSLGGSLALNDLLPQGGDGFADIAYSQFTGPNGPTTRVYIDLNDDGKLDASDLVIDLDGTIDLTGADFTAGTYNGVRGTPNADVMNGTSGNDALYGVAGNDTINGGAGQDSLYGGEGNDTIDGGTENDYLYGGNGDDSVYGGAGNDSVNGDAGNDTLEGQEGADSLYGGEGDDILRGGFGDDTLFGQNGNDTLEGGADNDTLYGQDGNDILLGQDGTDTIDGGIGDDTIQGGASNDTITGGAGNDNIDGGSEIDTAIFSGKISEYEIIANGGTIAVRDLKANRDGTDTLNNVEKLQFSDGTIQGAFLTVSDGAVVEGDAGQKMMAFTVSLIGSPTVPVSVNYTTSNGSATAGADYTSTNGALSFAVGETSKTVLVPVIGDTINEVDETFNLTLNTASGAAIVDNLGVGTILNDDVAVSIGDAQVVEGNSGTKSMSFTLTLDKPAVGPVSVSYKTVGGTATEGVDYAAAAGFVQFAAGESTKTVTITIAGDTTAELDESFTVQLLSATGAKIGDGTGAGTILNDDLNHAPTPVGDAFTIDYGTALSTTPAALLANDSDPDGQALSLVSVQGATNGSVAIVNGNVVFTPTAGFSGPASFTYTVTDGTGGATSATVNVTVSAPPPPPNTPPASTADAYTVAEDGTLNIGAPAGVLANDSDADGNSLVASLVTGPAHGTLTLNPDGSFVYKPAANYNGPDSFTYVANDGTANGSPTTVMLNVTPVNDKPVATADSYATAEDVSLVVSAANGVLKNDSDVDGNALTAQLVTGPAHGTLSLNPDGSFTYTPAANYSGADSFTYRANDGGLNSAPVTVTLNVAPDNDAPVAQPDSYNVNEDTVLTVGGSGVLGNDSDAESSAITATLVTGPAHGVLTLNANGSFTYAPNADYNGTDSFTYKANDGNSNSAPVTVTLNVAPVNDAPVATADSYAASEDSVLTVTAANGLLKNDSDIDGQTLTAQLVTGPAHGTLTLNTDGSFTYTPATNYNGPDSFTYRASDGVTTSAPVTIALNVAAVNDAPDAINDAATTPFNTPLTQNAAQLLANDTDQEGNALSVVSVQGAVNGSVSLVNGLVTFTPTAGFSGAASYNYTISDDQGGTDTATVIVMVTSPSNTAPVANADGYAATEDTALVVTAAQGVLANDTDADGNALTAQLVTGPAHGALVLNPNGSFTYTPAANYNGADSFTYRAGDGTATSAPVTVTLNVAAMNDAPTGGADTYTVKEDIKLTVAAANGVLRNDADIDSASLTAQLVTGPAHGTLTLNADGSFNYKGAANYNGQDSFTYRVSDGTSTSAPVTVTLNVTAANDAPSASADSFSTAEDNILIVSAANGVLKNDSDVDGDPLTAQLVTGPTHGALVLNSDGSFSYTPATNYNGPDSFTYRTGDGTTTSAPVTVTLSVTPVNDAPTAQADGYAATEDMALVVTAANGVLKNDSDVEASPLIAQLVTGPAHGTLTLNPDGSFTYVPAANYNGADSFTYSAHDGTAAGAPVTVTLNVAPVNDAPNAGDDGFTTDYQTALVKTAAELLANDQDVDGDTLAIVSVQEAVNGSVQLVAGVITFTPAAGFSGNASYSYTVSDGHGASVTATVLVTVGTPASADELFFSTAANESFDGGAGNDTLSYANVAAAVKVSLATNLAQKTGGGGTDTINGIENLTGSAFDDTLTGDAGGNRLVGGTGNDRLNGGEGNDWLDGGEGADTLAGGLGDDVFIVDNAADKVSDDGGFDTVRTNLASLTLATGIERLVYTGSGAFTGIGNASNNELGGGSGNDILDGKGGADTMAGFAGDDTYYVDNAGDLVIEGVGGGNDTVIVAKDWTLGAGQAVETLRAMLGTAAIGITGNEMANHLIGNDGANRLDGSAGADLMEGGLGNDIYTVDNAGDVVVEAAGAGSDTVIASIDYALGDNLENLTLTGAVGRVGTGNDLANRIIGSDGGDTLLGGLGGDSLDGGEGDDVLIGGLGADTLTGGAGADKFRFLAADESATAGGKDKIIDFSHTQGDVIDLSAIDANGGMPGDSFTFIGSSAFHGVAGELRFQVANGSLIVSGDLDGDKLADISFTLTGVTTIDASDFVL